MSHIHEIHRVREHGVVSIVILCVRQSSAWGRVSQSGFRVWSGPGSGSSTGNGEASSAFVGKDRGDGVGGRGVGAFKGGEASEVPAAVQGVDDQGSEAAPWVLNPPYEERLYFP